jgi:hypothetical protein
MLQPLRRQLAERDAMLAALTLLRAVAAHPELARPGDRLAWVTDEDEVARRAYEQWGFVGLKASARPAGCTSRHYMRRIER